jgi:glycosyl transferase family 2
MDIILAVLAILAAPLLLYAIDAYISVTSRKKSYRFRDTHHHDFTILVPIYGRIKYLENENYLAQYGDRVMLVTTGGETKAFMRSLKRIANKHAFQIFVSDWSSEQNLSKRSTSGTIRDRLIRDALKTVKTEYVVPLDADTIAKQPISIAIGELVAEKADIASVRLVPSNGDKNWLTKLQKLEYRMSMDMRYVVPWLVSGACQVAKTKTLEDIMDRHSLFFQGNDVEIGLLAKHLGHKIVHIPFEVHTTLPDQIKPWLRQRLAWSAGEFRLFIINIKYILKHPFFWAYGAVIVILTFPLRYVAISSHSLSLLVILALYVALLFAVHWRYKNIWLLVMPIYTLFASLIMVPLGIIWYISMATKHRSIGFISTRTPAVK